MTGIIYNNIQLNTWQIERLCNIVYLDSLLLAEPNVLLGDSIVSMKSNLAREGLPCEMSYEEWGRVLSSILNDKQISELHMTDYVDVVKIQKNVYPGHRAVCFMDNNRNAYVIFRGTFGDWEWKDNGYGMLEADTLQQKASVEFVNMIRKKYDVNTLTVAGHSKGGNKAQYVAITALNIVDRCFSFDGQGFSRAFMEKYKDSIEKRNSMQLLAEQRDFVNCLGFQLKDVTYYRGWRGKKSKEYPYGCPIFYFHCPDALREKNDKIGIPYYLSPISSVINQFTSCLLTDKSYSKIRKETIDNVILLLMKNLVFETDEIAEALAEITIVLLRMVAQSEAFNEDISAIFYNEADVIIASIEFILIKDNVGNKHNSITSAYISHLVRLILRKNTNIINLIRVMLKFINFLKTLKYSILNDNAVLKYIFAGICAMLESLLKRRKYKDKTPHKLLEYFNDLYTPNILASVQENQLDTATMSKNNEIKLDEIESLLNSWFAEIKK